MSRSLVLPALSGLSRRTRSRWQRKQPNPAAGSRTIIEVVSTVVLFTALVLILSEMALAQTPSGEYRVGPRDLLEIRVLEVPELNVERRVSDGGMLGLPLIGEVMVSGLTASEVAERVEAVLTAKYVNRANVTVQVKNFANKPVSILGAVMRPGALDVSGRWDLLQALLAAGGLAPDAGKIVYVLRRAENGLSDRLEITTDDLLVNPSVRWNIPIFPSDVVTVPGRTVVKIFCLGEVKAPGAVEFLSSDRITLMTLIARAGGLTDQAAKGSIRIKRRGADGKDLQIEASYSRIVSGKDPDVVLKPDDLVIIKESFF